MTIVAREHAMRWSDRRDRHLTGVLLLMSDGTVWFHPDNGDAPFKDTLR